MSSGRGQAQKVYTQILQGKGIVPLLSLEDDAGRLRQDLTLVAEPKRQLVEQPPQLVALEDDPLASDVLSSGSESDGSHSDYDVGFQELLFATHLQEAMQDSDDGDECGRAGTARTEEDDGDYCGRTGTSRKEESSSSNELYYGVSRVGRGIEKEED